MCQDKNMTKSSHVRGQLCLVILVLRIVSATFLGRAASGRAPEPPHATRIQPEPIRTAILGETLIFFGLCLLFC